MGRLRALGNLIWNARRYRAIWADAVEAAERDDWETVVDLMASLDELGLSTRRSRHWKATAHCKLRNW